LLLARPLAGKLSNTKQAARPLDDDDDYNEGVPPAPPVAGSTISV